MPLLSKPSGPLSGHIRAPPSKSATHRALVLSFLSDRPCKIRRPLLSDDTLSTIEGLKLMGASVSGRSVLTVKSERHQAQDVINARNSGTTARLLCSICSLFPGYGVITGDSSLKRRPMEPLLQAIRMLGGDAFSTTNNGCLPCVSGGPLSRGRCEIDAHLSSQFASSLAIASCFRDIDTEIVMKGKIQSYDYLKMTLEMIEYFGGKATLEDGRLYCEGRGAFKGRDVTVPGDFSSAAFLLAAAAITRGKISVSELGNSFTQADARIVEIMRLFGCSVRQRGNSIELSSEGIEGADVDCTSSPDLFPITSVLAAAAKGRSTVTGSENLRFKETDRLKTTYLMLRSIGVQCSLEDEKLHIKGGSIRGGTVRSFEDHRIAMAAVVAGLASSRGITVIDSGSYTVSYPSFIQDITSLGGKVGVF